MLESDIPAFYKDFGHFAAVEDFAIYYEVSGNLLLIIRSVVQGTTSFLLINGSSVCRDLAYSIEVYFLISGPVYDLYEYSISFS